MIPMANSVVPCLAMVAGSLCSTSSRTYARGITKPELTCTKDDAAIGMATRGEEDDAITAKRYNATKIE